MKQYLIKKLKLSVLKKKIKSKISETQSNAVKLFYSLFDKTVIAQNRDYKKIPTIIISFNQLLYLKQLVLFLQQHNYKNIVIIDNNSTYKPLLEYFDSIEKTVTIHRLNQNYGHLVFWKVKELYTKYSKGYYAVTDADINPVSECPEDFLLYFKKTLDKSFKVTKVGFSLKIDDLPDSNLHKAKIIEWESKFWRRRNENGDFDAGIDTTFALYRPKYEYNLELFLLGCRTNSPYTARHGGWYIDTNNLTEEQAFYFESCNQSSSWRVDDNGKLINPEYKKNN